MKTLYPSCFDSFHCLAGACPDSCCRAWEICIDADTASFYQQIPGALGEKLRRCLAKDAEGEWYFPLEDGRCPFLDAGGLCEIHAALGEEATGSVCRQYPWFIEEYEGFTEKCPSLSCPAAAALILSEPLDGTVYPVPPASADPLLNLLTAGRAAALEAAARYAFPESAARIWAMAQDLQEICDGFDPAAVICDFDAVLTQPAYAEIEQEDVMRIRALTERYLRFLLESAEILTEEWRGLLRAALSRKKTDGREAAGESADEKRVLRYFLYRYFLKPVNDGDILLWTAFILCGVAACRVIADRTGTDLAHVARRYSKEMEHDAENIDRALDFLADALA